MSTFKDATDAFASFTESLIKLKSAELLSEEAVKKFHDVFMAGADKFHDAIKNFDLAKPELQVPPLPVTQQQPVQQQVVQNQIPVQQPVQQATPPQEQKYWGYTKKHLVAQNTTVLKDIAINLQGATGTTAPFPQGGIGVMEMVLKEQLVEYIVTNSPKA